jgi:Dehydrogenases with different specificities (related to short-chain alcohol dehydrogenases)
LTWGLYKLYIHRSGGITKELMSPECKVAIVTGGTSGIGFSAACHLLKEGAKVCLEVDDILKN